jgi:hypothetical protein
MAFPVVGVSYGILDFTVQFTTGTSITDRIANGLNTGLPNSNLTLYGNP